MYWTDQTVSAKIERASMDGTGRQVLHSTRLRHPYGITIDYKTQRLYWTDFFSGTIESSFTDGGNRRQLFSGLSTPRGISIEGSIILWTDSARGRGKIHFSHSQDEGNFTLLLETVSTDPIGVEVVSAERQPQGMFSVYNFCWSVQTDQAGHVVRLR